MSQFKVVSSESQFAYPNFSPFVLSDAQLVTEYRASSIKERQAICQVQWSNYGSKWTAKYEEINEDNVRQAFVEYV